MRVSKRDWSKDWQIETLQTLCNIEIGRTPRIDNPSYWGGDHTWVTIADMSERVVSNSERKVTDRAIQDNQVKLVKKGGLLLSFKLSIGKLAFAGIDLFTNEAIASLTIKDSYLEKITPEFLYWALQIVPLERDATLAVKGKTLNKDKIKRIEVPFPKDINIQRQIVARVEAMMSEVREMREINQRIIEDSQSLLKASITDIFRQAPQKGWTEYAFGDLVNNFDGRRVPLKKGDRLDMQGPYSYYGATGVIDHVNQYLFDGEFLLVSEDGANLVVRKYPIAFIASGQFWVNNHAHVVQANDLTTNRYLAYAIEGTNIRQLVTGAAQPKLNQAKLNQISIWLPKTKDEQDYLVHYFDEIELQSKEMLKTSEQNHDLLFIAEKSILAQVFRGEF